MNYAEMMQRYATVAGLPRRRILPVPLFTPSLSSHWVGLITPVPAGIARPLVESLRNTVVCREHDIAEFVPDPPGGLIGFDEAVRLALQRVKDAAVATRWSSASVPGAPSDPLPTDPDWAGGSVYVDERVRGTTASPAELWRVVEGIGGESGWYSFPLAWEVRGGLDRLVGGVGLRRGRRSPHDLYVGEALDFWRVEALEEGSLLRLRAEMRLPGLAWLEFHVEHEDAGRRDGDPVAAAGHVRPARPARSPLLVGGRPVPRRRLRRDAAQHHPRRRAARLTPRRPRSRRPPSPSGSCLAVDGEGGPMMIRSPDRHHAQTSSWAVASSR